MPTNSYSMYNPWALVQVNTYDPDGALASTSYENEYEEVILGWELDYDVQGRITGLSDPGAGQLADVTYAKNFSYDQADRLTTASTLLPTVGPGPAGCLQNTYQFDARGNRTSQVTKVGETCGDGTQVDETRSWAHDSADRVQTGHNNQGSYTYDGLGRQTQVPLVDTPDGVNDLMLAYYVDDSVRQITYGSIYTTYMLDAAGRRLQATVTNTATGASSTAVRHYTNDSDNPAWVEDTSIQGVSKITRFETSIGGDLGIEITSSPMTGSEARYTLADPLGNIVATITMAEIYQGEAIAGIDNYASWDEYGNPLTATSTMPGGAVTTGLAYGWLGAKQRATDTSGLLLMGVRLYNPVTGLFTSRDPVPGGNSTTYTYPQDPINKHDITGKWGWFKKAAKGVWRGTKAVGRWAKGVGDATARGVGAAGSWLWRANLAAERWVIREGKAAWNKVRKSPLGKAAGKGFAVVGAAACVHGGIEAWRANSKTSWWRRTYRTAAGCF